MFTNKRIFLLGLGLFIGLAINSIPTLSALVSRITTFSDGSILTASQLNSEFNNLVDGINAIDDANISTSANINPVKINATIAGDGIGRNGSTGALEVNDDDSTLTISGDTLIVKSGGVGTTQLADDAVTKAKIGSDLTDNSTLEQDGTQTLRVKDNGITTAKIADSQVTGSKIASGSITQIKMGSLGQQISSSSGSQTFSSGGTFDVTNLSVTITTTGRPIFVGIIPDGSGTGDSRILATSFASGLTSRAFIVRDSTTIGYYEIAHASGSGISLIDVVSAGTYTYKLQVNKSFSASVKVDYVKLIAYEL